MLFNVDFSLKNCIQANSERENQLSKNSTFMETCSNMKPILCALERKNIRKIEGKERKKTTKF